MQADLHAPCSDLSLFGRSYYRIDSKDPNKLIPPVGSYAGSLQCEDYTEKALVRISPEGIFLFPTAGGKFRTKGQTFIRFHKLLGSLGGEGVESEIAQVEDLIY